MPTPDLLDFATLIAEIPGTNSAGERLDPQLKLMLDEYRTEFDPTKYRAGSPEAEMSPRKFNWAGIITETKSALTTKSKDLIFAVRLTEALAVTSGFGGLRDGLKLLRLMIVECWNRMQPVITEPGDEEARARRIDWLDDSKLPAIIRNLRFFESDGEPVSWTSNKDGKVNYESAVAAASREQCQLLVDDIAGAITELVGLKEAMKEKFPKNAAPALGQVSQAINDCADLAKLALKLKDIGSGDDTTGINPGKPGQPTGGPVTRGDIYKQINYLAGVLEQLDRHSPVPLLLRKAISLETMKFHDLVDAMSKNENVMQFLRPPEEKK